MALAAAPAGSAAAQQPAAVFTGEARAGNLKIIQAWSTDAIRFQREWAQPTPPKLTVDSATVRNKPIRLFLVFGGCKVGADGNCRLKGRFEIRDPDGKLYGDYADIDLWPQKTAPPPQVLVLSPIGMGLNVEAGEALGAYTIRLSVTDENAGLTATSEKVIQVAEAPAVP